MPKKLNIKKGDRFGRLSVVKEVEKRDRTRQFKCVCDCGTLKIYLMSSLRGGHSTSCGCKARELTIARAIAASKPEKDAYPNEHRVYQGIRQRCYDERCKNFKNYGGRGILMSKRWYRGESGKTGFACFMEDIGPRPETTKNPKTGKDDRYEIDRKNNDKGYNRSNCRWLLKSINITNTRRTTRVTYRNKEMTLAKAVELAGNKVSVRSAKARMDKMGWSLEKAVETPLDKRSITHNGKSMSIKEWSEETGIKLATINYRLRQGWKVQEVLSPVL